MKLFTYGFNRVQMDAIRWHFGKEEYIDCCAPLSLTYN